MYGALEWHKAATKAGLNLGITELEVKRQLRRGLERLRSN
jgi:hypothetical protein